MDFRLAAEMLELMARELREAEAREKSWMDYAFRLEEESGAALHRPKPKRDKTVTKTF
jgi:hypothetical protein